MGTTALIARKSELERLDKFLNDALSGSRSVCFVAGEPGSGKTSLIRSFADTAQLTHPELLVAYAQCDAFTGIGDPYTPFREILKLLTGDVEEPTAEGNTGSENASRLRRFLRMSTRALLENGPDLIDIFVPGGALLARLGGRAAQQLPWAQRLTDQVQGGAPKSNGALGQSNVFEQYTQVLEAIANEKPLLLLLDDLHWSDRASQGLLFHLARRLVNNPILMVGAYRPEELGFGDGDLGAMLNEFRRTFGDSTLDLSQGQDDRFTQAYLAALSSSVDETFATALARHTAGNPLFVVELLRHLQESGCVSNDGPEAGIRVLQPIDWQTLPSRIGGVVDRLLGRLTVEQREVLAVASVQGDEFWSELVAEVSGYGIRHVLRLLSGPLHNELHIVDESGVREIGDTAVGKYRFRHSLLREYLYRSLDANERRVIHRDLGIALEAMLGEHADEMVVTLASHFTEAGDWSRAARYRIDAGDVAADSYAPEDAVGHYRKALAITEAHESIASLCDVSMFERFAGQLVSAGHFEEAIAAYARARELTEDGFTLSGLWLLEAVPQQNIKAYGAARQALDHAEDEVRDARAPEQQRTRRRVDILLQRAFIYYWIGDAESLAPVNDELRSLVDSWGTPQQRVAFYASEARLALRLCRYRPHRDVLALLHKTVEADQGASADIAFFHGFVVLWSEQLDEAVPLLKEAANAAVRQGDMMVRIRSLTYLSVAERRLGNVEEVVDTTAQLRHLIEFVDAPDYLGFCLSQEAWLRGRAGEWEIARELAVQALELLNRMSPSNPFLWLAEWLVLAHAARAGDVTTVEQCAHHMLDESQAHQPAQLEQRLQQFIEAGEQTPDSTTTEQAAMLEMAQSLGMI